MLGVHARLHAHLQTENCHNAGCLPYIHVCAHMPTPNRKHTHTHTSVVTNAHIHTHACIQPARHACACASTHTSLHVGMPPHMHSWIQASTHPYTVRTSDIHICTGRASHYGVHAWLSVDMMIRRHAYGVIAHPHADIPGSAHRPTHSQADI